MNKKNYKHLIEHYVVVDEYLDSDTPDMEDIYNIIVSFSTVSEKILKIKLHKKNPVLIFDNAKLKDLDSLVSIIKKKNVSMQTLSLRDIAIRFQAVFPSTFTDDEIAAMLDIYSIRNEIIHGYKSLDRTDLDLENILKKMGTVWIKISTIATKLFDEKQIKLSKPKKIYTQRELEDVLEKEVEEMIRPSERSGGFFGATTLVNTTPFGSILGAKEKCPRCGQFTFSIEENDTPFRVGVAISSWRLDTPKPSLYKCSVCNLELTKKQYEIAKKINQGRGI